MKWFYKIFGEMYSFSPLIYIDDDGKPIKKNSDRVRWLGNVVVFEFTERRASKKAFKIVHKDYPEFKGFVRLM